ncbi:MAG: hypothetical protein U0787_06810 [Polyangia bacterium]
MIRASKLFSALFGESCPAWSIYSVSERLLSAKESQGMSPSAKAEV